MEKYGLTDLPKGVVVYGEIYGSGIQPGYGCADGERKLALFDAQSFEPTARWMDAAEFDALVVANGLPRAPVLFVGPYAGDLVQKQLTCGPSVVAPEQKVREGCVVRPAVERTDRCGRAVLKSINPDYLVSKHADEEVAHDLA